MPWITRNGAHLFIGEDGSPVNPNSGNFRAMLNTRSGTAEKGTAVYNKNTKTWTDSSGNPLPEHLQNIKIPPAWENVQYSKDGNNNLLVTGKDGKGRSQAIYSEKFTQQNADAKFARISELDKNFSTIKSEVNSDISSRRKIEEASAARLVMATGIRPGGDKDTGAEKQAYGATTLLGGHVVGNSPENTRLQFVGKKGVNLDIPVSDKTVASDLLSRRETAGADGRLFKTDASKLSEYVHEKDGGGFKTKDFRTLIGTRTAIDEVSKMKIPSTKKEYEKSVRSVAKVVSVKLGNTPTVALQSYISPVVFANWKVRN